MKTQLTRLIIPIYLTSAVLGQAFIFSLPVSADTLKGGVNEDDVLKGQGPSLNRGDMSKGGDPFSGGNDKPDDGMLKAPPGAFDNTNVFDGTPKPFQMNADSEGGAPFNGQQGVPQAEPNQQQPMDQGGGPGNNPMRGNTVTPNDDPEKTGQMQLLWDAWHKRVAETIYVKFSGAAQMFFKHSQPLACQVSYMVARDGRIGNVRILQPSANPLFNTMLIGIIKSIAGNPVLEYPPNSKRQFVEKTGTFTWNYSGGQGYRYTTGDQERIQQKGR